jgi:hypothetical protein
MDSPALIVNLVLLLALLGITIKQRLPKKEVQTPPTPPELTLTDATKKADEIIAQAEMQGLKIAGDSKQGKEVFSQEYAKKLEQSIATAQASYVQEMDKLVQAHSQFLNQLKQQSMTSQQETESMMKARINELLFSLEQNLTTFLNTTEQKSFESLDLELKSARALIDTYRTQQLSLIDENIVAVLERTVSLVIKNKITLADQLDLVYESLEKAKVEKLFA